MSKLSKTPVGISNLVKSLFFKNVSAFEDATIKKLYLHLSSADMTLHVLTNRKIGHLVIFDMMI